ncbi:MAG: hypothetical protein K0A99_06565 [Desulfoarculaceae bacterium]|nr:hypothetical protein [Desulfoarculaceae bacterium]
MSDEKQKNRGEIIPRSFFKKISVFLAAFFVVVAVAGQIYLYFQTKTFLEFHYSAVLLTLARIKDEIFLTSMVVSLFFFIIPSLLAAVFLVVYSHRIAGPMSRIKQYLRGISGKSAPPIRFREKDVLHVLADSINAVQQRERDDFARICANLAEIEETLAGAVSAHDDGLPLESLLQRVSEKCAENSAIMAEVKL